MVDPRRGGGGRAHEIERIAERAAGDARRLDETAHRDFSGAGALSWEDVVKRERFSRVLTGEMCRGMVSLVDVPGVQEAVELANRTPR
ncbi:hypothetical protein Asp14428_65900 [Actinoplanes sp. NBRC 14428]|nr:hypothetical protein Asp14428_65900 [Actinoplanes sp. NBRC 14428]